MKIAICGKAGSGKSTMANYLIENFGFVKYSFAAAVKEIGRDLFGMTTKDRSLLQHIGAKMREIDQAVWIRYICNKIMADGFPDVVVDDLRYKNEELFLRGMDFVIIKLVGDPIGRQKAMTPAQRNHPSELEIDTIVPDYVIDTENPLEENYKELVRIIMIKTLEALAMSKEYYEKAREKSNINYVRGRNFEYRVMALLRSRGYHTMRKFGSHDDIWKVDGKALHVPLDVTAYKNGVYLMITCKYSILGPTTIYDDPKRENLVRYAEKFGALPVFAGIDESRHIYFVDLRSNIPYPYLPLAMSKVKEYGKPKESKVGESQMQKLLNIAWDLADILKAEYDAAEKPTVRVRWAGELVKLVNILNRLLKSAGDTATEDDITTLLTKLEEELEENNGRSA